MEADEEVEAEAEAEADFSPTTLSIGFIGCKKFPAEELPVEICESADGDFFGDNPVVDRRFVLLTVCSSWIASRYLLFD